LSIDPNCLGLVLLRFGFETVSKNNISHIYENPKTNTCIIIDVDICEPNGLLYIDYTTGQNELVFLNKKLFRFLLSDYDSVGKLTDEIQVFLSEENDSEKLRKFGRDRTKQDIDPTPPEAVFEDLFIDAFGEEYRNVLYREFEYFDFAGKRRFVDYALFSENGNYAIELNGESYHHPQIPLKNRACSTAFLKR